MYWINSTDMLINPEEKEPDKRIIFRQVGWLGQTGRFYSLLDGGEWCEKGGFSPVFVQREV